MSPTTEAPTLARASGAGGGGRDRSGRHGAAGWAGLLLLTAVAAGLLGQGAFYARVRWYVGVLAKVQLSPEEWEVPGLVALVNYGRKKLCAVRDEVFHGPPTIPNSSVAASGSRGMV